MKTDIQPVAFWNDAATQLEVSNAQIRVLGGGGTAFVYWRMSNAEGTPLRDGHVTLQGAEYDAWGNDDSYLLTFVTTALGLVPVTP